MLKTSDITNNTILAVDGETHIGAVHEVIIDVDTNRVLGFLVGRGGWSGGTHVLPWPEVVQINFQHIIVKSTASVVLAREVPPMRYNLEQGQQPIGADLVTSDNRRLGTLTDVFFDSQTGEIMGYEVSDGNQVGAYITWRSFVPSVTQPMKFRDDVLVVPQVAVEQMETRANSDNNDETAMLGQRAQWNVRADDGEIIVARGQIVDRDIIDRAHEQGVEKTLQQATGTSADS